MQTKISLAQAAILDSVLSGEVEKIKKLSLSFDAETRHSIESFRSFESGFSFLHHAATSRFHSARARTVRTLLECFDFDASAPDNEGRSALALACADGDIDVVEELLPLADQSELTRADFFDKTPLRHAADLLIDGFWTGEYIVELIAPLYPLDDVKKIAFEVFEKLPELARWCAEQDRSEIAGAANSGFKPPGARAPKSTKRL